MYSNRVSVIIATFNGASFINKQIDSILQQSVPPEEIIVCDDNSTDDTAIIINRYKATSNIKLFVNDKQLGIVNNFKKAAGYVRDGNWVVFSDQDDIWVNNKLEILINEMRDLDDNIKPALIYSDLSVINKEGAVIYNSFWEKQKINPETINLSKLLYGNVVTGCTMMINHSMLQELILMDNNPFLHDEWLALISYSFGAVKFLNEKLVLYRQHESNATFSENYEKSRIIDHFKEPLESLLAKSKFLSRQFDLAKLFLSIYRNKLNENQIHIFEKFIMLEDKHYLIKRINRLMTFS